MGTITIRTIIIFLALAGIGGYALYESRNILSGPVVVIESPRSGSTSNEAVTDIAGSAKNISKISLNDREIFIDESGRFKEKFVLSVGTNTVKISAEDRFGRRKESFVEIVYGGPGKPLVKSLEVPDYQ